jgi:hypothetical protein
MILLNKYTREQVKCNVKFQIKSMNFKNYLLVIFSKFRKTRTKDRIVSRIGYSLKTPKQRIKQLSNLFQIKDKKLKSWNKLTFSNKYNTKYDFFIFILK